MKYFISPDGYYYHVKECSIIQGKSEYTELELEYILKLVFQYLPCPGCLKVISEENI